MMQGQVRFAGWRDGAPAIHVQDDDGDVAPIPLRGAFTMEASQDRYCIGRAEDDGWSPCPSRAVVSQFDQCPRCGDMEAQECIFEPRCQSDPSHCSCDFGQVPHVVYLAFYGVLPKVGMTSAARVGTRLQEQGADAYLIVAPCPDRATARLTERRLAFQHGIPEYRTRRETLGQLTRPMPRDAVEERTAQWRQRLDLDAAPLHWVPEPPLPVPLPARPVTVRTGGEHAGTWLGAKGRYLVFEAAPQAGRLDASIGRPLHVLRLRDLTGRRLKYDAG